MSEDEKQAFLGENASRFMAHLKTAR